MMAIGGTAPAARLFHLELRAMAREIPSQNCNHDYRYKHSYVRDAQMHAGRCPRNDLTRYGTVIMSGEVQIKHRD
jgi:hypothetical protein